MLPDKIIGLVVDLVIGLVIVGLLAWFGRGALGFLQAPAERDAAIGANAALAKGVDAQNKGVDALKAAGDERKAKSEAAVNRAGGVQLKRAADIQAAPAVGATDYERAVNRIDRELGLK